MKLFQKLRSSFSTKLLMIIAATTTIPLIVFSIFFLSSFHNIYNEKHRSSVLRETTDLSLNLDNQLSSLSTYLSLLCQDADIRQYVDNWSDAEPALSELREKLSSVNFAAPRLIDTDIIVINQKGNVIYGGSIVQQTTDEITFYDMVCQSVSPSHRGIIWFTDAQVNGWSDATVKYCFIAAPIRVDNYGANHGYIALRMRQTSLVSMYLAFTDEQTNFFVLDSSGSTIASVDTLDASSLVEETYNHTIMQAPEYINADPYILYPISLSNSWVLVAVTPAKAASADMSATTVTFLFAMAVTTVTTLLLAYFFSRRFVKPIGNMIIQMDYVSAGNLNAKIAVTSHDELEKLADHYNRMIDRLQELVEQIVSEQEEKKKAALVAYQTQINPHFLMNTLSSMRYMIYSCNPADVDRMILALTNILKYALSGADEKATLNLELEQLRNYLIIQQFGFDVPFQYHIEIAPDLGDNMIVKLLLQPLVENAVLHGLKPQNNNPSLWIRVQSVPDNRIGIAIEDNGIGFQADDYMRQLRSGTCSGIGLNNIYNRLLLHYGNNFSLNIDSRSSGQTGTRIYLTIPKESKQEALV